jgi:hypothetical protein
MKLWTMLRGSRSKSAVDKSGVNATDEKSGRSKDLNGLYLYVSDCGWQARFVDAEGAPIEKPVGEDLVFPVDGQKASIQNIISRALDKLGKRTLSHVGFLTVVLDDPSIILVEDSVSTTALSLMNVKAIREFGAEHLGVDEVSYGFSNSKPLTENEMPETPKGGLYGFIEIATLRDYLSKFGNLAPKLLAVTPAVHTVVLGAAEAHATSQCHIFMSAYSAVIAVFNIRSSVAVIRSVPVGIFSISGALAEAHGLPNELALGELQRRDCMTQILLSESGNGDAEVPNQFERILGPVVRRLGDEIDNSLNFFHDQRTGSEYPVGNIVVHGTGDRIKGLATWLSNRSSIPVNNAALDCIEGAMVHPSADLLNLLSGAQGPLFKIGKTNWTWDKNKISSQAKITEAAQSSSSKQPGQSETPKRGRKPSRREDGRRGRGRQDTVRAGSRGGGSKQEAPTFFGLSLGSGGSGAGDDRAGFALLALITILFLYSGYALYIKPELKIRQAAAAVFTKQLATNGALRRAVDQQRLDSSTEKIDNGSQERVNSGVSDKVLWTEKFLALGCYASEAIWLTDVYLTNGSRRVGAKTEKTQKLVIKGAVLPSYDGHLLHISEYIHRLEKDPRNLFMADFETITFEGAVVDLDDVEEVVKFSIEAWYDSKREKGKRKRVGVTAQDLSMSGCVSGKEPRKKAAPEKKGARR